MFDKASQKRLHEVLALSPHIQEVHLAHIGSPHGRDTDKSKVHEMNKHLNGFGIQVKELSIGDFSRDLQRGLDISF